MRRLLLAVVLMPVACTTTPAAPTTDVLPCDADSRGYICCQAAVLESVVARATKAEAMCAAVDGGQSAPVVK